MVFEMTGQSAEGQSAENTTLQASSSERTSAQAARISELHLKRNLQGFPTLERHVETPRRNVGFVTFVRHV
jgi:hypothetical protein